MKMSNNVGMDGEEELNHQNFGISPIEKKRKRGEEMLDSPSRDKKELPRPPEESFMLDRQFDFDSPNDRRDDQEDEESVEKGLQTPKKIKMDSNDSMEKLSSAKMKKSYLQRTPNNLMKTFFAEEEVLDKNAKNNNTNNGYLNHNSSHHNEHFSVNSNLYLDNKDFSFNGKDISFNVSEVDTKTRYQKDFQEIKKIGQTHTSSVFLAKNLKDSREYAIKMLERNKDNNHEIEIISQLKNTKYLLRYYCSWEELGQIYIQSEYCNLGSLRKMFKAKNYLNLEQLLKLIKDVSKGLSYLHKNNLCHRDIKPGNIYLCDEFFKIGDFGITISCDLKEFQEEESVDGGDGRYISPEFMNLRVEHLRYHIKKADIFSLGCSVFELSTKKSLTSETNEEIRNSRIKFPQNFEETFGPSLQNLIMLMLTIEPENRPSAEDLLNHELIKSDKKKELEKLREEAELLRRKTSMLEDLLLKNYEKQSNNK